MDLLDWRKVRGGGEVKVVTVYEDLEGSWSRVGVRGADEERMELDLTRESRKEIRTSFVARHWVAAFRILTEYALEALHRRHSSTQAHSPISQPMSS